MDLLNLLSPKEKEKLTTMAFKAGEILCQEGDFCDGVHFVEEGRIKIASYSMGGNEMVYNSLGPGEMFGNNLAFSSDPRYRGAVIGVEKGTLGYIKKTDLMEILMGNQRFLQGYLEVMSESGKKLNAKIRLMSLATAEERLEYWLSLRGGKARYLSVTALAGELSLTREACSRALHRMSKEGRIVLGKKLIELKEK